MSHTATGEWKSFEIRMRRRRAERLVLRADVAAEAGYADDARAFLEEARTRWPAVPGLAEIQRRIDAPVPAAAAEPGAPRPGPSRSMEVVAAAAAVLFVCAAIGVVAMTALH